MLNDELTVFFSVGFILIGMLCALSVRRSDLFTAGVLPPLLLAIVMAVFAFAMPRAVSTPTGSISNAWVAGLAHHAGGLVSAHAAALLIIGLRMLNKRAKRTRAF
jgi:TRAP-type C4-dicarboxylate transport system permease large subunit